MPRVLGLINARKGSKGIPGKNIKPLQGKPLIAWSVETARQCPSLSRVIVSTDGDDIARVARQYGAETPFTRPPELATDDCLQIDVITHAVEWLEKNEKDFYDYICLLQPTSPLRSAEDVEQTLALAVKSGADSAVTICDVGGHHPYIYYRLQGDHKLSPFIETLPAGTSRQSFPPLYRRAGSVYVIKRSNLAEKSLYGKDVRGYEIPYERSINIDEPFDWDVAELLLKKRTAGS
ncbi:MAG: acylneuraminate cytidylyltransferase family protein [Alphaproteobacteria bacterium]|nr:acylneuraminate cytidylyltransferase family protein [Alphaproteobacteria bacterium]